MTALCATAWAAPTEFVEESFLVETGKDAVVLAGTLTLPKGQAPVATVVFISGSGGHVRDQVISGTPMFAVMAKTLARQGVASLRVDDRGVGDSSGPTVQQSTTRDRADDIRACLRKLRGRQALQQAPLGLIGHSEGAIIAPIVAAEEPDLAFLVLLSAPTRKGATVFIEQQMAQTKAAGTHNREEMDVLQKALTHLVETVTAGKAQPSVEAAVTQLFKAWKAPEDAFKGNDVAHFAAAMSTPWRRYFFEYDPAPALRKIEQPVMVVYGAGDLQTAFATHAPMMLAAITAAPTNQFDLVLLADEDHFFLRAPGEPPGKHIYGKMVLSKELQTRVGNWILTRVGKQTQG